MCIAREVIVAPTVRLSPKAERTLNALAKRERLSRSDVVREALARYAADDGAAARESRPYDAWIDVIGVVSLGARAGGETTGEQFAAILRERSRVRRAR
jgi:hypothetical protein